MYQTDSTQSAAPFITQATVLNTAYSTANTPVTAVDPSTDTITVQGSDLGPPVASSPILFGSTGAQYGFTPGVPYYVASTPTQQTDPATKTTTYSFKVSTIWKQQLSEANVPIQGDTGTPGPIVELTNPGGPVNLQWGPIQPVSQLGSQQLTSGKLVTNAGRIGDDLDRADAPARGTGDQLAPDTIEQLLASIYPGVLRTRPRSGH